MDRLHADLTGDFFLIQRFDKLGRKSGKKVLSKSMRAGVAPIRKAARRNAPKEEGELKKGLISKLKFYRDTGTQIAIVGVRKQSKARFYLHLVEDGTQAHDIKPRRKKALLVPIGKRKRGKLRGKDGKFVKNGGDLPDDRKRVLVTIVHHPGYAGKRFLAAAASSQGSAAAMAFRDKMSQEITKEATTP